MHVDRFPFVFFFLLDFIMFRPVTFKCSTASKTKGPISIETYQKINISILIGRSIRYLCVCCCGFSLFFVCSFLFRQSYLIKSFACQHKHNKLALLSNINISYKHYVPRCFQHNLSLNYTNRGKPNSNARQIDLSE